MLCTLQFFLPPLSNRSFCCYSGRQDPMVEMSNYKEVFSRRMTMAGLKPHHKIALGVSGGVDSIALCILTAGWKTDAQIGKDAKNGCINGLLAIVVDHGLREESKTESNLARNIVSEMGVRCEIASCNWPSGMPKQGHLQEAARDMRYRLLQKVCMENQINVLLVAHHADDQAELFILRLSRNSSVLGLAGMAFTSQLFTIHVHYHSENSSNHGILLVRPLLEFTKADLYNICQSGNKTWVEDPTNKKTMYARNRIRKKLNSLSSMKQQQLKKENTPMSDTCEILICDKRARNNRHVSDNDQIHVVSDAHLTMDTSSPLTDKALDGVELSFNKWFNLVQPIDESPQRWLGIFKSEIQAIILACRKSRSYVDKICCDLIKRTVTVTPHGCAIIDLEKLDPANVEDICLSKFIALVLQFISQRHRPVRGRTSKLVLDYIRNVPCKNSLTAAACYLCAAPQSKGTKILVCCSPDSPQPSTMELSHRYYYEEKICCTTSNIEQILMDGKTYSDCLVPDVSNLAFLHATSPVSILNEAKRLNIISDSTLTSILLLQKEENESFNDKSKVEAKNETRHGIRSSNISLSESLRSGQCSQFMNRFYVMWRFLETTDDTLPFEEFYSDWRSDRANKDYLCKSCVIGPEAIVRHMLDSDWLYLARLSKDQTSDLCQEYKVLSASKDQRLDKRISCSDYVRLSAQRALRILKSIPVAARRGLPVLVNSQGLLLSIPNVYFKHCPLLSVSAVFKPKVPLGGGHSSFL